MFNHQAKEAELVSRSPSSLTKAAELYGIIRTHVDEFIGKNAIKSLP